MKSYIRAVLGAKPMIFTISPSSVSIPFINGVMTQPLSYAGQVVNVYFTFDSPGHMPAAAVAEHGHHFVSAAQLPGRQHGSDAVHSRGAPNEQP